MRRARISIKPNVRPGGRSVAPAAEDKSSQGSTAVGDTQQTLSPSPQSQLEVKESAVATGDGNVPGSPSEKASLNINDGAPSSVSTPATTVLQRRSRFSTTPNLGRPKVRSAPPPSTGKTVSLPSETSKTSSPFQAAKSFPQSPIPVAISRDDSQNSTFSDVTTAANYPPSSPCLPSTSGCPKSPLSTASQQKPCQTPQKIPNEDFGPQGVTPVACTLSPYVKLSRVDGPDSPLRTTISSDKQRVLRALKLKELMKLERKKEGMEKKSRQPKCEHGFEPDRDKMTLADFIYYLPESNPMKSSLSTEETQTQTTAPPTPTVQKNMAEAGDEEDDDDADEELLVPKVKVAEDGSLILDEESLTVRVQRTSDTVVENANPLFERGSTTTYTSFRKKCYVKNWSVRETDMFYLAISMVGTDFSLITQLLTHRSRTEIKSKFKKEERANAWRVDKAFRNKRPYDSELFSFLLKRVLAKDKQKGKSIKLVVKSSKAKKGKDGKKVKQLEDKDSINDDDDELCSVDSVCFDLEKENEDSSNMNEADVPSSTSKKRKRTKDTEPKTCKASRKNKTPKKAKCLMEAEDGDLVCVDNDLVEEDSVNADSEDQSCMPVSKKTRKQSKKGDQEGKELKLEEKQKKKKNKKTLEVRNEEPTDGESGAVNEEHNEASAVPTKKRKRSKKGEKEEKEPTKRERKTKKSKTSQEECTGSELGADGSEVSSSAPGAEEDQGEKHFPESAAEEVVSQSSFKRLKRPNLAKRKVKICSEPKATVELEDTVEECQDESCREADNELRIICLAEDQLQNQPVVVLERTPPRLKDSLNSSEIQNQPQPSQSPQHSPGRQMRAEKVKRNLTASGDGSEVLTAGPGVKEDHGEKLIPESTTKEEISQSLFKCSPGQRTTAEKNKHNLTASEGDQIDQCHTGSDPSPEDMSSTAMANQVGMQDSKEADQCMEEGLYLQHLEFLTSSEVNGQTLRKRAVVLVSHDEVKHYLRIQAQTTAEESTGSESQQDTAPSRDLHVVEHRDGLEEQGSTSGALEERVSQEVKETDTTSISAQQSIVEKRRRFSKPKPSLSRAAQSIRRPLNVQTTDFSENAPSFKCDSVQLQCSSPVEVQVKNTPNECLLEEHRDRPEEESTCSVTPEENGPQDVQVQDDEAETTVDDLPSLTSVGSPPRASKILPILGMPQVLDTTPSDEDVPERRREFDRSPSQTSENEDQITEPVESEVTDAMIEEPQTELKRIIPVSCSADGSSVYTQDDIAPERHSHFDKQTPNLEGTPPVMINPQQTLEPKEDSAEKPEAQSPVQALHSNLDHDIENISREDKLLSSEVDLQERKLDEPNDPVLSDASSAPFEAHSLVSPPNEHASNLCDMNTMQFSESVAEDIQIPGEQDSEKQDCTEEPSEASEECSAPLNQNAKSEISDSAGVDTDKQSEEEPTFILTLYEIPASQLFHEAAFGQQGTTPYELQPAQFQTPSLLSSSSHFHSVTLEASSASLHLASEETSNPCKSSSRKIVDDSLDPLSKDAVDGARTQLISSQESSRDDVNPLISPPAMFSCNSATPTDVPKLDEILTESPETKAPTQRRCKIKVKPKLKRGVKVGPSKNGQFDCAPSQYLPPSQATAQTEIESNQRTSAQGTVGPKIHSSPEDRERRAHPGPDAAKSTALVPVSEDMRAESQVKWESPLRTELLTDEDTVVDPPVHSTFIKESEENTEAGYEGVSHMVLADGFVLASGEMKDVFNKEQESPHDSELQKPEDISVCRTESEKSLPTVSDQKEKVADIAKKPETYSEASCVTSSASQEKTVPLRRGKLQVKPNIPKTSSTKDDFSRQERSDFGYNDPAPLIKEESIKVEQRSDQEDFSDIPKEELDREPAVIALSSQLFSTAKTSACTELQPVELKIEDGHEDAAHVVLSDILVPVSAEMEDGDHMTSGSSIQSSLHMREESQQAVAGEAAQETHSHEGVSHMLLTDILIPVCEQMADDLSKEWTTTTGKRSPLEAERSQVREDPDTADLSCAVSQSSNVGPSVSPKRKIPTLAKGKLLVDLTFPKRKTGDSPKSDEQSQTVPLSTIMSESTQCSAETCAGLLPIGSEDCEEACGGVSHMVLSDILVPVLDETAECTLHKEAFSAGLKEDAVNVKKSTDIERPTNTETEVNINSQSVAVKWKTPDCRRGTLHPKPKLSKRKDDSSETDLRQPSSTQTHLATSQQSLDPQAAEWSLKSNMLPMDSDEIENWCEGVSHMLLSDAFVPVSEEIGESSSDLKVCLSSIPHKDEQIVLSPTKSEETPSEISSEVHQLDTTSDMPKTLKSNESLSDSQAKNSPTRSTFQMTLRSPERRFKVQPCVLKSTQAPPTTPPRTRTSNVKESMGTPTRQQTGEISSVCRIQLERLSVEEICSAQCVLQPKHHSTPVTVKTTSRGNEMHKASLVLHGSRSSGLESHADEVLSGYSPRVVLHRIPLTATDENTSTPTSSPARVSTTPSRTSADHQSPQNSPPVSDLDADKNPVRVSHFLLDDIFTEVVDSD